jgi:hypothetical protein|tara:strand:- start:378 stop:524 length:147 start_codon:yes stop_codon:yes gene_type:complete
MDGSIATQILDKKDLENIFSYQRNIIAGLFVDDNYKMYLKNTIMDIPT